MFGKRMPEYFQPRFRAALAAALRGSFGEA
jgi:hypothetical protein